MGGTTRVGAVMCREGTWLWVEQTGPGCDVLCRDVAVGETTWVGSVTSREEIWLSVELPGSAL